MRVFVNLQKGLKLSRIRLGKKIKQGEPAHDLVKLTTNYSNLSHDYNIQ